MPIPYALTTFWSSAIGAAIPASIAGAVALYASWVARRRAEHDRRRESYSEAYRLALAWCEGLYRVRRRPSDGSGDRELVQHFHELQESIAYYEGWLSTEHAELGTAYRELLDRVMAECKPLIQGAWRSPGREPTEPPPEKEAHPNLQSAKDEFLAAVRKHAKRIWT